MYKKDGIIYEREQEYMLVKDNAASEPKPLTTSERVWLVLAVVCVLLLLLFLSAICHEGFPNVMQPRC